jgi:hypothetical protein
MATELTSGFPLTDAIIMRVRTDEYAERKWNKKEGKFLYYRAKRGLNSIALQNHNCSKQPIGVYVMRPGSDQTEFAALDFDDHEGNSFEAILETVKRVRHELDTLGLYSNSVLSGGGKGVHLLLVFVSPQSAKLVRRELNTVLEKCGFKEGTGGVAQGEIEIFPKQDKVGVGKYGNLIALPFSRESVPLDPESYEPLSLEDAKNITVVYAKGLTETVEEPSASSGVCNKEFEVYSPCDLKRLREALKFVPADDYDLYFKIGAAIHHATSGSEEGLQIWMECSCKSEKFNKDDCKYRWGTISEHCNPVTAGTIFYLAKKNGWQPSEEEEIIILVAELNLKHCVAAVEGKTVVINEELSGRVSYSRRQDFIDRYANQFVLNPRPGKGRPSHISVGDFWFRHEDRRQFDGVFFEPGVEKHNMYNLYKGLAIKPAEQGVGSWSLMQEHITYVICSGDIKLARWVIAWLADVVQNPGGDRPGTALVIRGKQGTGKGILMKHFGHIFGIHYCQITQQSQLLGKFNAHLQTVILAFIDEGVWAGDKAAAGVLKGLITEPTMMVEPKGINAFKISNHLRLVFSSNNDWVVPAGLEERRFCVLDVADTHQQDHAYFAALDAQMKGGGLEAMLLSLLKFDISGFNLRQAPLTQGLSDQIELSMDAASQFWLSFLRSGNFHNSPGWPHDDRFISTVALHHAYAEFCGRHNQRHMLSDALLIKRLLEVCPSLAYHRPTIGGKRVTGRMIPPIKQAREEFLRATKMQIQWDTEDTD